MVYRWTSLFYGDHTSLNESRGSQESLDAQVHKQDKVRNITRNIIFMWGKKQIVGSRKSEKKGADLPIVFPLQLITQHKVWLIHWNSKRTERINEFILY